MNKIHHTHNSLNLDVAIWLFWDKIFKSLFNLSDATFLKMIEIEWSFSLSISKSLQNCIEKTKRLTKVFTRYLLLPLYLRFLLKVPTLMLNTFPFKVKIYLINQIYQPLLRWVNIFQNLTFIRSIECCL